MKVAIVCDWLTGTGGAERVVKQFHHMFPEAPIYTSQYNSDPKVWYGDEWFAKADVRTSWLQNLPLGLRKFLPVFRALYFSRLDLSDYDLVISSSGAEAKGVKTGADTVHVSYCHSPTHYYWSRYDEYLKTPGFGFLDPLAKLGLRLLVGPMRRWDKKAAQRPDYLIANSKHISDQIFRYYGRKSTVINPPVDLDRFKLLNKSSNLRSGFVAVGRQTPYKRIDLAVAACSKLSLPLTVMGSGPQHAKLVKMAGPTVKFINNASDEVVAQNFQKAMGFIFPAIDDFGIVAVEALAAGTPVIAYGEGGALDYVQSGKNGLLFKPQTVSALAAALVQFGKHSFNQETVAKSAGKFTPKNFETNFNDFLKKIAHP